VRSGVRRDFRTAQALVAFVILITSAFGFFAAIGGIAAG
jgi:hypothetical protein